jgi:adenylate cyclase
MTTRILVVDDEPDLEALILQKFRHQIRDGTYDFRFARDGVEALETLKADDGVVLVVTDINMPRMDGLTLLQKLQEADEKLSTIVVSAYGDMANIRTANEPRCVRFRANRLSRSPSHRCQNASACHVFARHWLALCEVW